jgi:TonB family protein
MARTRGPNLANNPKQAPKLAVKANPHEQTVGLRREPMGSPAVYKPLLSLTQNEPKRRNSVRGSTTVTFETGPAGTLRFVQVGQSSGNARLNQLALATVRAAAPFPPPPVLKDGTPTYTIRINFR